jgi:hypothetical protein
MKINSDINILGSLPDWDLINLFFNKDIKTVNEEGGFHTYTAIKTDKSVKRFEKAITVTFLQFKQEAFKSLFKSLLDNEQISQDTRLFLFWNASLNNELLDYLNRNVFFPAFYSGRVSIRAEEVTACLNDLKQTEVALQKWSEITIKTTASKYLTLLKKFGLMEGSVKKSIVHPYLNDKMFVYFIYWMVALSEKPNLLGSDWLKYNFSDYQILIERLLKKRFTKFFNVIYTGDRLQIEPLIPYHEIYETITKS